MYNVFELNMYGNERSVLAQFRLGILPKVGRYRQKPLNDWTCPLFKDEVEG